MNFLLDPRLFNYVILTLYVCNTDVVERLVTIEWGGVTAPDDNQTLIVPAHETALVTPGLILTGGLAVRAFASAANVLVAFGWVNRIA